MHFDCNNGLLFGKYKKNSTKGKMKALRLCLTGRYILPDSDANPVFLLRKPGRHLLNPSKKDHYFCSA